MKQQKQIKKLVQYIKSKKTSKIFFFFDYDGVLVPLQNNPTTAFLSKKIRKKLLWLASLSNTKVAVVSGRNLSTLKRLSRIRSKKIILIGTHGLEIQIFGKHKYLVPLTNHILKKIKTKVIKFLKKGAKGFIEKKPYSISYHIRDPRKNNFIKELSNSINLLIKQNNFQKQLRVQQGKKLVEILPYDANKGKAVEKTIKIFPNYFYIYLGDDITDISAFKIIKKYKGISISLNKNLNYKADFLLASQKLTNYLLEELNSKIVDPQLI